MKARRAGGVLAILIAAAAAAPAGIAGCTATTAAAQGPTAQAHGTNTATSAVSSPSPSHTTPKPKPTPTPVPPSVVVSSFRAPDGSLITLAEFRGAATFRLHAGSADPGYPALSALRAGPAVVGGERRRLLAAFNGGFKLSAGDGGYEQEGHVISPLIRGLASLVIDRSGAATIGVWGDGLPRPGEAIQSVRQNLSLLVSHGEPTPIAADWGLWGATLGGGELVARSALGQDAAGQLIFAGSMSASPADLAAALVHAGARRGMELDINPAWVQLDVARHPGHALIAAIPGQQRPPDQFLVGWVRDFITVLAPT